MENDKIIYRDMPCSSGESRMRVTDEELLDEKLENICMAINSYIYNPSDYTIKKCIDKQKEAKEYLGGSEERKTIEFCENNHAGNYIEVKSCLDELLKKEKDRIAAIERQKKYKEGRARFEEVKKDSAKSRLNAIAKAKVAGLCYVEYVIENVDGGVSDVSLTYANKNGGTEQHDINMIHDAVDFLYTIPFLNRCNMNPYISAQKGTEDGIIEVQILLNGKEIRSSKSSSPYGIASVGL
ncbi:hypothetical protein OAH46_01125 [Verrucomicrobia bacterium]|nr:hypothetical protein [Verrucomicrobiota bacterium]